MSEYETDIVRWSEHQAALLRRLANGERVNDADLDWQHLAEEIESVGANQKREVRSRLAVLCQHLLKWAYQPELRSQSWRSTIRTQREDLWAVLDDSPILRPFAARVLPDAYGRGRDRALDETGLLHMPELPPWSLDDVLATEFWPDAA